MCIDDSTAAVQASPEAFAAYRGATGEQAGRAFLDQIDSADDELTDAQVAAQVDDLATGIPSGGDGLLFNLTGGNDTFAPNSNVPANQTTTGDDEFTATVGTLDTGDLIDGGAGRFVLNAVVGGTNQAPTVRDVEFVNITANAAASALNLANMTGVEMVTFEDGAAGNDLTLNNVAQSQMITMSADADLTINYTAAAGSGDAATIGLDGAGDAVASLITANGIESVTFDTSGASSNVDFDGAGVEEITISGSGALTLDAFGATLNTLETVDASGQTAAVTLDLTATAGALTVTGGAGADTILVSGDEDHVLTGGAGADTFDITGLSNLTAGATDDDGLVADLLEITDYGTGSDSINLDVGVVGITGTVRGAASTRSRATIRVRFMGPISFARGCSTILLHAGCSGVTDDHGNSAGSLALRTRVAVLLSAAST